MASAAAAKKCPRPSQSCGWTAADQPDVGLVDEGGRLEGVPGLLVGQAGGGELPQLVVDEREQVGRGRRVALLDGVQELGDVGHAAQHTPSDGEPRPESEHHRRPARHELTEYALARSGPARRCSFGVGSGSAAGRAGVDPRCPVQVRWPGPSLRVDRRTRCVNLVRPGLARAGPPPPRHPVAGRSHMPRAAAALAALVLLAGQTPVPAADPPAPADRTARLAAVGRLWGVVKFRHPAVWTTDLDWDAALTKALPAVTAADTAERYADAVDAMLARLGDPATRVIRPAGAGGRPARGPRRTARRRPRPDRPDGPDRRPPAGDRRGHPRQGARGDRRGGRGGVRPPLPRLHRLRPGVRRRRRPAHRPPDHRAVGAGGRPLRLPAADGRHLRRILLGIRDPPRHGVPPGRAGEAPPRRVPRQPAHRPARDRPRASRRPGRGASSRRGS